MRAFVYSIAMDAYSQLLSFVIQDKRCHCRAPPVPLAAFLSPVLWRLNQPDRFDMYSIGIILMQMAFPPLRSDSNLIAFNQKLEDVDWDLNEWRNQLERKNSQTYAEGFKLLDADNGAGWDLLQGVCTVLLGTSFMPTMCLYHGLFCKCSAM